MNQFDKVLAIDGPSGSGKSDVAQKVASKLGILYIDTGAMFRALGYYLDKHKITFTENSELQQVLAGCQLQYGVDSECQIAINGENLTTIIREHRVSTLASKVSKLVAVRNYLLEVQRSLVKTKTCVMEGRDIGTVVFPHAFLKIFLTADNEIRADRRWKQLRSKGDTTTGLEEVLKDLIERDKRDTEREVAPLKQDKDAVLVDTSDLSLEQVVDKIVQFAIDKASELNLKI